MRGENLPVSTVAGTTRLERRAKDEMVTLKNQDTANSVFISLSGIASTTLGGPDGSIEIPAGQERTVRLTEEENPNGASLIAATATVNLVVVRTSFRNPVERVAALVAYLVATMLYESLWMRVSSTVVKLRGSFVEARMDRIQGIASTGMKVVTTSAPSNPLNALIGAGGAAILTEYDQAGSMRTLTAGTRRHFVGASEVSVNNATPFIFYHSSGSDVRHQFTSTARQMRTVGFAAPPSNNTVFDVLEIPIVNGAVLNPGDLAEYPLGSIRVQPNALGSLGIEGVVETGGTGNAAGTVTALVRFCGILTQTLVADTGGVIQGQNLIGGGVNVGRVNSQANIEGTFAHCLTTAAATALTDARLNGVH